ncbi:hypothetical protein PsYK624_030720 [Phanerochaete sordida]|uniref:Uncharacterized protein n=1 Tax=Phanerochaete sordida TaxID=48140 RepID=A0A9P3G3K5_9APHY|nr:hypothetical protein PsYK624_030720 [Phanerochaete sordida]
MAESADAAGSATAAPAATSGPQIPLAVRLYRRIVASMLAATFAFTFISSIGAVILVYRTTVALPFTLAFVAVWESYQAGTLATLPKIGLSESVVAFLRASATGAVLIGLLLGAVLSALLGVATLFESPRWRTRVRDRIERARARQLGQRTDQPLVVKVAWNTVATAAQLSLGIFTLRQWYEPGARDSVLADPWRAIACSTLGLVFSDALLDKWVWSKYRTPGAEQREDPDVSGKDAGGTDQSPTTTTLLELKV